MTFKFRFAGPCREIPSELNFQEQRKACHRLGEKAGTDCSIELYFGFFFDGTRNNMYVSDRAGDSTHTNVARLWDVFDDELDPSYSARQHRFRTYIEGVGTPCVAKVADPGTGVHAQAGAAAGWGGESRINWALLEFQNHLYSHFVPERSLTDVLGQSSVALVRQMSAETSLSRLQLKELADAAKMPLAAYTKMQPGDATDILVRRTQGLRSTFQRLLQINNQEPKDSERYTVLSRRNAALRDLLAPYLATKPAIERIRVSVFGFSRGAAAARVFVNWLGNACDPPQGISTFNPRGDGVMRLAGIPVNVDFMGLFDTVASAGLAQGVHENAWDGHGAWARKNDMKIPFQVSRCVHMVAAHEVRGSFPVDLIEGAGCEEIVYPGVHSDLGGGYKPAEQGRGAADADKLSQIPLCDMYREAVQAGVPLRLEGPSVSAAARGRFAVSPALRAAFNAYVEATRDISTSQASTSHILYGHYIQYLRWRRLRAERGPDWLGGIPSSIRARQNNPQDYEDLVRANDELLAEVRALTLNNSYERVIANPRNAGVAPSSSLYDSVMLMLRGNKEEAWAKQIEGIWNLPGRPAAPVIDLLDNFVHDSRAWFKPLGEDDDVWRAIQLEHMRELESQRARSQQFAAQGRAGLAQALQLDAVEQEALSRYEANPEDLPLQTSGREFYWQWGYLRWRSVFKNTQVTPHQQMQQDMKETQQFLQNNIDMNKIFNGRF
ncbi:Secreted protein Hcp [plant metagenome]|uniref:Secreted protein Hcp n=1 Tax=plant metagenome TaxID=1297885 RepID=A0A484TR68_9ZZZZ